MARENNLKEYKSVYNIDSMPVTGAGSEFGREAKEEARRKKFGYIRKKYHSEAQPWLMQLGSDKNTAKKFVLVFKFPCSISTKLYIAFFLSFLIKHRVFVFISTQFNIRLVFSLQFTMFQSTIIFMVCST